MVSVVIPVYNREATIERAIRSVLDQTYSDFEIIVVDDGSRDQSQQIIEKLQRQNRKIRYFRQENLGPSAARNKGIAEARSEYIAFLDSDDYWYPQKLAKQIQLFSTHHGLGMVYCWAEVINRFSKSWYKNATYTKNAFGCLLAEGNFIATSSAITKKTVFNRIGYFDEEIKGPEDFDLWLRIADRFKIDCVKEYLVIKHEGAPNSLQNNPGQMFENLEKIMFRHLDKIDDPQKRYFYLARYYRRCLADFYNVPEIYHCFFKMIKAYPHILLEFKTYRSCLSFVMNNLSKSTL